MKLKDSFHFYALDYHSFWSPRFYFNPAVAPVFFSLFVRFPSLFLRSCVLLPAAFIFRLRFPDVGDIKWFLLSARPGFSCTSPAFNKGCETVTSATAVCSLRLFL
jgi:hypothetical protein